MGNEEVINKDYLQEGTIKNIKKQFELNKNIPSVHLHQFLEKKFYMKVKKELQQESWKRLTDILAYSYENARISPSLAKLFHDPAFLKFLSFILCKKARRVDASCYSFGWKDYTVLHDLGKEKAGFDIVLDFSDTWDSLWDGSLVYTESKGEGLIVPASGNSLLLVQRKNIHIRKFLKYVNHYAGKNKRVLVMGKIVT